MIEKLLEAVMQNYERGPQFFMNSNKYTPYTTQMTDRQINSGDLVSVSLQCSGHGSFRKQALATRFVNHLAEILQYNEKIKKIKIKISGFDLSQDLGNMSRSEGNSTLIKKIANLIGGRISYLSSLQIRVSNVTNCSVQDFKTILNLGVNQEAKQLTNLSCQFSDWTFTLLDKDNVVDKSIYEKGIKKTDHDRNGQPSLDSFFKMLDQAFQNTVGSPMQDLKKFRLQISTWYYSDFQIESFFYGTQNNKVMHSLPKSDKISQRVQYFHNEFKTRVQAMILNIMPNLTNMQIDLRNWNKMFEMSMLKSALINISNRQRMNSLSQISRRHEKTKIIAKSIISMVLKEPVNDKRQNQKLKQMQEEEKQQYFDFNVVI